MFIYIFTFLLGLAALILQGHTSFDAIRFFGVKPDLLFILVVYVAYSFGSFYGQVTGFFAGVFHDSISNSPLGLMTFPKVAVGFVVGMFGRSIIQSNWMTVSLMLFIASLFKGIITLFLAYIFDNASAISILNIIFPEAIYNAFLAPFLFSIFDKIYVNELEKEG